MFSARVGGSEYSSSDYPPVVPRRMNTIRAVASRMAIARIARCRTQLIPGAPLQSQANGFRNNRHLPLGDNSYSCCRRRPGNSGTICNHFSFNWSKESDDKRSICCPTVGHSSVRNSGEFCDGKRYNLMNHDRLIRRN